MSISYKSFIDFIKKLFEFSPENIDAYLTSIIIVTSIMLLVLIFYIAIIRPLIKLFSSYINNRKEHAKARIEDPSGFSWGNSLLRVPLLAIGTDIFAFAQSSVKSKSIRYIKAISVFIPVVWCMFSLTLLIGHSKNKIENIDFYILGLPIILVGMTIFVLDLSIIINKGSRAAKITRILIAIITGYLFSSIPLDYIYKSDIDSYLAVNDSQITTVKSDIKDAKKSITDQEWYKKYKELETHSNDLLKSMDTERRGEGVTNRPNSPDPSKNPIYNQINKEYQNSIIQLNSIREANKPELERLAKLESELTEGIKIIQDSNSSNHIKRHLALWSYALSSLGTALFFFCCVVLFWVVDSLAVLTSFLDESEYDEKVAKHDMHRNSIFQSEDFVKKFSPIIAEGTL